LKQTGTNDSKKKLTSANRKNNKLNIIAPFCECIKEVFIGIYTEYICIKYINRKENDKATLFVLSCYIFSECTIKRFFPTIRSCLCSVLFPGDNRFLEWIKPLVSSTLVGSEEEEDDNMEMVKDDDTKPRTAKTSLLLCWYK
jgi:hypothetical protein